MEKLNIVMDHCPSCYETLKENALDCSACGIVIANYKRVAVEKRLKLTISGLYHLTSAECMELEAAWAKVESLYFDNHLHNQFIHHCLRLKSLPYAVKKYSEKLSINPLDDIASVMKNRVMILAGEMLPRKFEDEMVLAPVLAEGLMRLLVVFLVVGVSAGSVLMLISALTSQKFFFFGLGLFLTLTCLLSYSLLSRIRAQAN